MTGYNEKDKDFTTDSSGGIHGLPPGQFEFGERYVTCRKCRVRRPASELKLFYDLPVCKDHGEITVEGLLTGLTD
jgi:hypothetical protein